MNTTNTTTTTPDFDALRKRLRSLTLYGLAVQDNDLLTEPWLQRVIDIEDRERKRRSLERRLTSARVAAFKPIADFDWVWPKTIDRKLIDELFSLAFINDAVNVVLLGPNGIGKTMIAKNLVHTPSSTATPPDSPWLPTCSTNSPRRTPTPPSRDACADSLNPSSSPSMRSAI